MNGDMPFNTKMQLHFPCKVHIQLLGLWRVP